MMGLAELAKRIEAESVERDAKLMASAHTIGPTKARLTCDKGVLGVALEQGRGSSEDAQTIYMSANDFARLLGWFQKHCAGFSVPADSEVTKPIAAATETK
jgi:hypothetical protein